MRAAARTAAAAQAKAHPTQADAANRRACCVFCGFECDANELHHLNDNHTDLRPANLGTACALCHRWQHLTDLGPGEALVCYLPGLAATDINHLQRTILIALARGDGPTRADALAVLNWMASRSAQVEASWGTSDPAQFGAALLRQPVEEKELREIVFQDLGVVFRPKGLAGAAAAWLDMPGYRSAGLADWQHTYHTVMHAPL